MAGIGGLNQQTKVEREPGTLERTAMISKRLGELQERLRQINSALHGPRPEDAGKASAVPSNLTAWIGWIEGQLDECGSEIEEIFHSLGL